MMKGDPIDISGFSEDEVKSLAVFLLQKIAATYDPKKGMGRELFNAMVRLKVTITPEAACLRKDPESGNLQIYLIRRAPDDSAYPGQWHMPGSAIRPGEEIDDVFLRLEKNEIGIKIVSKKFGFHFNNPAEVRGHFFSLVYLCELENRAGFGKWFAVDALPENTLKHHSAIVIPAAIRFFSS